MSVYKKKFCSKKIDIGYDEITHDNIHLFRSIQNTSIFIEPIDCLI